MIRIDSSEIRRAADLLRTAPDALTDRMLMAVWEAQMLLMRETKERTPRTAGTLADSIIAEAPMAQGGTVIGVVQSPLHYAAPVELGSRPHLPPLQPLVDWVEAKLGIKGPDAEGIAQAIRWKIRKHGSKGQFMFRDALEQNRDQIIRIVAAHVQQALSDTGLEPMA